MVLPSVGIFITIEHKHTVRQLNKYSRRCRLIDLFFNNPPEIWCRKNITIYLCSPIFLWSDIFLWILYPYPHIYVAPFSDLLIPFYGNYSPFLAWRYLIFLHYSLQLWIGLHEILQTISGVMINFFLWFLKLILLYVF